MHRLLIGTALALALIWIIAVFARRHARTLIHERRIRIDRFKLRSRHADIEREVFASAEVVQAIADYGTTHQVNESAARAQGAQYLKEIVPKFNLLAYYRFGAPVARTIVNFLYRVVVERKPLRDFNETAPRGSVVVYVINHRSNTDYVLVAHLLFKFISLSYAVGEWARVWPLNHLFKWFGAYFIRRRFREPLYHAVLAAFVGTITRRGVTQGIFIEGGLTRDGAFREPKLGMLDYIVSSKRDPQFDAPLFIIPTAINYDRVLEDRNLTEELVGKEDRSTRTEKLRATTEFLFKNFWRSLFGRFKRYGYAVVAFGDPILVDDFIRDHPELLSPRFEDRKPSMRALAELVMHRISEALPVTPVPLIAKVFAESPSGSLTEDEIVGAVARVRQEWSARVFLLREHTPEEIWKAAKQILLLRHFLEPAGDGAWRWNPRDELLRDYYARSLLTFEEAKAARERLD